jgi:DNA-binding HxlR family transcriptional regulator
MFTEANKDLHRIILQIGDYTKLMIIAELTIYKQQSFNELKKKIHSNPNSLSKKLKQLMLDDIVMSSTFVSGTPHFYYLSVKGQKYATIIESMKKII